MVLEDSQVIVLVAAIKRIARKTYPVRGHKWIKEYITINGKQEEINPCDCPVCIAQNVLRDLPDYALHLSETRAGR